MVDIKNDYVMREMAKLAMEEATLFFAKMARDFAKDQRISRLPGNEVLEAFARAIENTNRKVWPAEKLG